MFQVTVKRGSMKSILQAVRDLEARGYDYVTPIRPVYKTRKDFLYNENKNIKGGYKFGGMEEYVSYECCMKKVN
ncbi:hypothetical protein COL60_16420 [Bacillus pseudomycoides]|uniref:hypothetical protein n=1 Tax=Bacillus pseudomycoides TaxID=64104 RepID=UPI000BF96EC5|nr:hypothetical protein [Bacillus pseudomycoides]PFZ08411.1 hypothetical protein COL60_16420 [Bacillus pseudomycoides]PFZ09783.1 hypothetical protein COL63_21160 [Bacillus pseudomycoides]